MQKYLRVTIKENKCYGELVKNDNDEIKVKMYSNEDTPLTETPIASTSELLEYLRLWSQRQEDGKMTIEPLSVDK